MRTQKSSSESEELARAYAKIAELEAAQSKGGASSQQEPSFILESITDGFVAVDLEFRYVWVNAEAERLLGIAREQLIGKSLWEFFPTAAGSPFEVQCRQAIANESPREFDYFYAPWNRWFYCKAYPTTEGGLAIYWRDTTQQKRLLSDLRRQALVLAQVHDSVITTDLKGIITHWNSGAEELFGYSSLDAVGQPISMLYFEEERLSVASKVLEPLLRKGHAELEMRNRRKSGEECYIRISLSLLRDEDGQPYAMLGVSTDITAQKRAERALRESEAHYRGLADAMPQIAYVTSAEGKTELINQHWQQYAGIPVDRCLELQWLAWVHPDDIPALTNAWTECVNTGELFEKEYRLRNAKGVYRWHLGRAVPVQGNDGAVAHWVGVSTDIHARRCAEEALLKSEDLFRLASGALQGIVYDWNPQTGIVQRNGNLERIVGVRLEDAQDTATWWQERVHPKDLEKTSLASLSRLTSQQSSYETEFRIRHADGHWVHVCDRGYIVRDEQGVPIRVVGSTQDISERKALEHDLKDRNARLKFQADLLAATKDAVIAIDAHGNVTYFSPGAEQMYGVESAAALGKPLTNICSYEWLNPEDESLATAKIAQHGIWKGENIHVRADGSRMFVSSTVNVLAAESGGGLVAVLRDISEKKKTELAILKQSSQLAQANEDLTHFAYAVSHDLQAPLRTVVSFSQLLALKYKTGLDDQASQFIRMIVEAGNRMTVMIRDLLEFARCAGTRETPEESISLKDAFAAALNNLAGEIRATGAFVTFSSLPEQRRDLGQFIQVFQNLIGNSLKYRKPETEPVIHVSAERREAQWIVQVRDNGIGFKAEHAADIFGVFKRLHGSQYAGTGVGLAICKRIVERHGGKIGAASSPGDGAVFTFSIPDEHHESTTLRQDHLAAPLNPGLTSAVGILGENEEARPSGSPFDEFFQALDLAQAMVRDLNGKILIWTKGAERLFGWAKNEALGHNAHQLLRTKFPMPLDEIEAELLKKGEWKGQLQKFRKDGRSLWLASHWALHRDGSGRPQSVIEVNNDITALKEAEDALQRSSRQRDLALHAGEMGVWRWDKKTDAVEWDETTERLHGMEPGSFGGTFEAFQNSVHPADRDLVNQRIAEAMAHGPDYTIEFRALRADGKETWLRGQGQVVFENGEVAGLIGVVWDISWRKQQELK